MVTRFPSGQEIARKWFVVDGSGQTLGRAMGKKLKVYKGDKHEHQAQKPEALALAR
jgi:ribosomal protein L13